MANEKLEPHYTARIAVTPPGPAAPSDPSDPSARAAPNAGIRVSPGLTATAKIKTDERRVIDYLLSPLERRLGEAGRER